jgi:hypothetical protein
MYASCCFLLRTIDFCPLKLQVCTYSCRWAGWMSEECTEASMQLYLRSRWRINCTEI